MAVMTVPVALWAGRILGQRWHAIPAQGGESIAMATIATPYYLQKADIQRFLDAFDGYKRQA